MKRQLFVAAALAASITLTAQDWQPVIAQLRDASAGRRIDALKKINDAGYQAGAEFAAPLVTDPEDAVQLVAIDTELTLFLSAWPRELKAGRGGRSRAQEAFDAGVLARAATAAPAVLIDNLVTATADRNPRVRFDAIHTLGVIGEAPLDANETRRLMEGLQHSDAVVRTATARVLGRLRATTAGDALVNALNDSSELVQEYATEALGRLAAERAVQALTNRVTYYRKGTMANAALLALARIAHPSSRDLLRSRLDDADPAARRAAVEGVGRLRDVASLEKVRAAARPDAPPEVRLAALYALDRLGEPQLGGIAQSIGQPALGDQAQDYLFEAGPSAAASIAALLAKSSVASQRARLAALLGYLGGASDAAALESAAKDADPAVARAAANALLRVRR